jgi:hypothetical protein
MTTPRPVRTNMVRFSGGGVTVYRDIVARFNLQEGCSIFPLWDVLGADWVFFTPPKTVRTNKFYAVNAGSAILYAPNYIAPAVKRGCYNITRTEMLRISDITGVEFGDDVFVIYKLEKIV